MGAAGFIIIAAGMVIPIVILLATVLFDAVVIVWTGVRMIRNRWSMAHPHHARAH